MPVCHLVSAGDFAPEYFHPEKEDLVIACDGGLSHLLTLKYSPDLLVGDFDSFEGALSEDIPTLRLPREKDDTDTLYALRLGLRRGYTHFALHGCLGGKRLSHTVTNLQSLAFLQKNGADGVIYGKSTLVYLLKNSKMSFDKHRIGYLSVFALSSTARVKLIGLKYPFDGILSSDMPIGVSNEFIGNAAEIEVLRGSVAIILENEV